ncbi:tissue alpha-L-fucosidase [Agrilus planipennis]|uniref:Putative alpha-L-fucosidase n=1 Tax=Agrilus planipennis TaxID=224129 RepID=A0A7F5RGN7_AGRPL|nr:tissue alpha-L-fucosidase [Agrilus planipennis]
MIYISLLLSLCFTFKTCISTTVIVCHDCERNVNEFQPTWESLDSRKLPQWYDDAKFGIFLHWGVYSVPGFGSEWFWNRLANNAPAYVQYFKSNYPPNFTYQDFARDFTAEFYEPGEWAELFKQSGARYVVLTSKHHEGYTLWPSEFSFSWNSKDVGPHKDLLGDLANAIRSKTNLKFGVYHSLYEWFNPMYQADRAASFSKNNFITRKILPEMIELVEKYKPEVIWSDGDWEAPDTYWQSTQFLAWLYNESPVKDTVVVNDRWGKNCSCRHGDFYNCKDHYDPGTLQKHKWESATTVYKESWGHVKNTKLQDYRTPWELISLIVRTVSCGGNVLLNVGPTKEGTIDPIFQERLLQIGEWLSVNGEAIYETRPWTHQNDSIGDTWYTHKPGVIYATTLKWPDNNVLKLGHVNKSLFETGQVVITLLGYPRKLKWVFENHTLSINFPERNLVSNDWAWSVKITNGK